MSHIAGAVAKKRNCGVAVLERKSYNRHKGRYSSQPSAPVTEYAPPCWIRFALASSTFTLVKRIFGGTYKKYRIGNRIYENYNEILYEIKSLYLEILLNIQYINKCSQLHKSIFISMRSKASC